MAQQKIPVGIAQNEFHYGPDKIVTGMASSDYAPDGALGVSTSNINPYVTRGALQATAAATTPSGTITGAMIASCEDGTNANGTNTRFFVDDAAHFYLYNGSFTSKQTGSATYKSGITDMVFFNGKMWASSTSDITKWDGTATAGSTHFDETYWTTTKSQSALVSGSNNPHPLLVFNNLLWIGDANLLHSISSAESVTNSQLTLPTTESIIALGIDPTTGLMLISTVTVPDYTGTTATQAFVYLHDGYSSFYRRKVAVDAPVTSFYTIGAQTFVAYGQNIGYWNGSGITFLRKLKNVTFSNTSLPYKHRVTNIGNTLFVVDGSKIISYGEVIAGQKAWFYIASSPAGSANLLCYIGANKLGIAGTTGTFSSVDLSSSATGTGSVYFNNVIFPRPVLIRRIRVITGGISTTSGSGIGTVGFVDETFTNILPATSKFIVSSAQGTRYVFDFEYGQKAQVVQPFVTFDTAAFAVLSVIVYYDVTAD